MTVSTTLDRGYFAGDGSNKNFPFNFRFFDNSQIYVYVIANDGTITGKTLNVDYTLSGAMSPGGGQVVFTTAPPLGVGPYVNNVLIQRIIPQTQPTSIRNQAAFFPATHEDVFDRLTMLIQQALFGVSNGLQLDPTLMYWDFKGRRGINAADPVNAQDVTTKNWVANYVSSVSGAIVNANGVAYGASNLYEYLKTGVYASVATIAALRLLNSAQHQRAVVSNYYAGAAGGGGDFFVNPSDTTSADNGGTIIVGADGARWYRLRTKKITLQDFGADTTGVADAVSAITQYSTFFSDLIFPEGQYKISTPITLGPGKNVTFETNASINVLAGASVTFGGSFTAQTYGRLFFGAGVVVGIREVIPEWFGAVGDGTGDQRPAFQAAMTCVAGSNSSQGGRPTIRMLSGLYQVNNPVTFFPTGDCALAVIGAGCRYNGTRFMASTTFPAEPVIHISGTNVAAQQASDFIFKDFAVVRNPSGVGSATAGIRVGHLVNGYKLEGYHCSLLEDILVLNYPIGIDVIHSRLINFNRVSAWNDTLGGSSTALHIRQLGGFTGDHRFTNCQFVSNTTSGNVTLRITSNNGVSTGATGNMIAGIKFVGCDIYQADTKVLIFAGSGSWIADIWFDQCQWDGNSTQDLYIESNGTGSKIDDLHFANVYMAGGNLSTSNQITITKTGAGNIYDVHFNGGCLQLAQGRTMLLSGAIGVTVNGCTIRDNNNQSGPAIESTGSARVTLTNNKLNRVTGNFCAYFIALGAANYLVVSGNMGAGIAATGTINDASGAVTKSVVNNL